MKAIAKKRKRLQRRHFRLRRRVVGTPECPRLLVKKSLNHTYAQLIDDDSGKVLISINTRQSAIASGLSGTGNKAAAAAVGKTIGDAAVAKGIKQVCFDRAGRKYHGRVQAVADAAREAGLKF
jgi:large subunit ribosomal protein L18